MKKYQVNWTRQARSDLDTILTYISQENPQNAKQLFHSFWQEAKSLITFPKRGRCVPELQRLSIEIYREKILSPWRIVYRISGEQVVVVGVFDSRRDLEDLLQRRAMNEAFA